MPCWRQSSSSLRLQELWVHDEAFAIVIIGGFGNVEGTILAGLIVGLIESYTTQYLDPGLIDIVVFALLLVMLAIKPTGLISERREENV